MADNSEMQKRDATEAMRIVLRWFQHREFLPDGNKASLATLAQTLGVSRDQLTRFLGGKSNRTEENTRFRQLWPRVRFLIEASGDILPVALRPVVEYIYGPEGNSNDDLVVPEARVFQHRAMARTHRIDQRYYSQLFGLSILLRPANETPRDADRNLQQGWSVALMNVPPRHVQAGEHHPIFKLRQRGLGANSYNISGIVAVQEDRFVFQGIDDLRGLTFNATLPFTSEEWSDFRNLERAEPPIAQGVMLGLSTARSSFAGCFDLIAVPNSVLSKEAAERERTIFRERYLAAREACGVRTLDDTRKALSAIGINVSEAAFEAILSRSHDTPLLTAT